jgi:hypothetical protein
MVGGHILGVLRLALAPAVARARSGLGRFKVGGFPGTVVENWQLRPCTLGHLYSK